MKHRLIVLLTTTCCISSYAQVPSIDRLGWTLFKCSEIRVSGKGFDSTAKVYVEGHPCPTEFVTNTLVLAQVPDSLAGKVTVHTTQGISNFRYLTFWEATTQCYYQARNAKTTFLLRWRADVQEEFERQLDTVIPTCTLSSSKYNFKVYDQNQMVIQHDSGNLTQSPITMNVFKGTVEARLYQGLQFCGQNSLLISMNKNLIPSSGSVLFPPPRGGNSKVRGYTNSNSLRIWWVNSTQNVVQVSSNNTHPVRLVVRDLLGKTVHAEILHIESSAPIRVALPGHLNSGAFICTVNQDGIVASKRIMIQR
jgi:hypothetical protein